jgi:thymidylate synthase (FAD)
MRIIKPSVEFMYPIDPQFVMKHLEACGRVCYKSEDKIEENSAEAFLAGIIKRGHEAVLEHVSISVKFICDRGVTHEIVRHRMASYCQESTRYCNYSGDKFGNEITVIEPCYMNFDTIASEIRYEAWAASCQDAEYSYFYLLNHGCSPQEARAVLPNSLKTELIMTANIREWRHFLRLRCGKGAHPQMREVALMLLQMFYDILPALFGDVYAEVHGE